MNLLISLDLLDIQGLLESLSAAVAHPSLPAIEQDISSLVDDNDIEARQMRAVAVAVLAVLDSLSEVTHLFVGSGANPGVQAVSPQVTF